MPGITHGTYNMDSWRVMRLTAKKITTPTIISAAIIHDVFMSSKTANMMIMGDMAPESWNL